MVSPKNEAPTARAATSKSSRAPRSGIHVALWIPTDAGGKLQRDLLTAHVEWLRAKGLHGILALGSTGEFARMNYDQRETILAAVIEAAAPLPVIANISSIRLQEVIALGQSAERLGAVGVAIMPPPFFPLAQDDILEFFLRAAEKISLPVYLYNYPEVTGNRIGLEVISAFSDQCHMAGIKQSGNELDYHHDLIQLGREKDFSVFTAADPLLGKYLDLGADGCLGGMANFAPEYMLEIYDASRAGRTADASVSASRLAAIGSTTGALCLPLNVRSAFEARGFDPGAFKTIVSPRTMAIYRSTVDQLRSRFAEWELPPFGTQS
ncbi:MAG TPA: dihydrodipicolinate synthase family protein [Terrimicrobiaceae bacterium]|nr:dihydrodipicolinate synthase family protein [Terrimicrobiaceae bacterium]